jgi:hypothetical protein
MASSEEKPRHCVDQGMSFLWVGFKTCNLFKPFKTFGTI